MPIEQVEHDRISVQLHYTKEPTEKLYRYLAEFCQFQAGAVARVSNAASLEYESWYPQAISKEQS